MNCEWEIIGKEVVVAYFKVQSCTRLEELRKSYEHLDHNSRDSNRAPHEYKPEVLPPPPRNEFAQ
jgi:hypothetical protein